MIRRLEGAGLLFGSGMTDAELDRAEDFFQFRFPGEIREFLSVAVPQNPAFFNFRDLSQRNMRKFRDFQESIVDSFRFDLEHNRGTMYLIFVEKVGFSEDFEEFDKAVLDYLRKSVRLIPFYGHRCFFDGMDHMPIVSFRQPTDVIFYGGTFWSYLEHEFLRGERILENVQERMKNTGIWSDVIW